MELELGQKELVKDLKNLLEEVENGEFGDFSNNKYVTPKMELRKKFLELAQNVIEGKYD